MQPEKYNPNVPPPQQPIAHDPYGFITNPPPQPKGLPIVPNDPFKRRLFMLLGGVVLLVIIIVILSSLFSGGKSVNKNLLSIAQSQQEIIRLNGSHQDDLNSSKLKNFAANASATLTSQQQQLIDLLSQYGGKADDDNLILKQSAASDEQLASAVSSNTLDTVYVQIMRQQLTDYQAELQSTYDLTNNPETQDLIQTLYDSSGLLDEQLGKD